MIRFDQLQVEIRQNWNCRSIEMWVLEWDGSRQFNINLDNEGNLVRTVIDEMQVLTVSNSLKPFMNLPSLFAETLFKKIAEYNDKNGIKTVDQNLLEGKLQAQEKHLEDMREISKKVLDSYLKINIGG